MPATNMTHKAKPTLLDRLFRKMGFCYRLASLPDDVEDTHPHWCSTHAKFQFGFWDRILLLFTGRLTVEIEMATEQDIGSSVNATSYYIMPPLTKIEPSN